MSKQTAVEFLAKSLKDFPHIKHSQRFKDLVEEAKAMEKEQMEEAYEYGSNASLGVSKTKLIQSLKQGGDK